MAALREERFELLLSPAILLEAAVLVPGEIRLRVVAADPADDRFLECAVEGAADYLVTGDGDLLGLGRFEGVPIVTPRAFLRVLERASAGGHPSS